MSENAIHERLRTSEQQLRSLAARLQAVRERERTDLARELHDELGQTLTHTKFELARTAKELRAFRLKPETVDRLQSIIGQIEVATETVRRISTELRPPALDHLGLGAAIELEAAAIQRRTGLRCRVSAMPADGALGPEQATAIFRVFQEAVTNVLRHARASSVRVRLREAAGAFTMTIQDNGRGITAKEIGDPGAIGLLGMRERARRLGGSVEIAGQRGKGTTVTVRLPLAAPRPRTGKTRRSGEHDARTPRR